jgi:hypothetical protein
VTVSADGVTPVATFMPSGPGPKIKNDFTSGVFTPTTPLYVVTNAGSNNWPLKGIGYQVQIDYELAAAPPTRRMFKFGDPTATYDNQTSHQFTVGNTALTITAAGAGAMLDTNGNGVGVNSSADDADATPRFINGSLSTPEAMLIKFNRDVNLESFTLGNLSLDATETVLLKLFSGPNPFTGLSGYSGNYTLGPDSLAFAVNTRGQTPYTVTYGKNGQDPLFIEKGTVLSLTANPSTGSGFLLDMLTVHVVPEPVAASLAVAAATVLLVPRRRRVNTTV